jgi:hypothetical protein
MAASSANSRKPFQRIIRFPSPDLETLARHVEILEDNIAKKFRGVDSVAAVDVLSDDRIIAPITFSLTAGGIVDVLVYTVPETDETTGHHVTFVLSRNPVWVTRRLGTADTGTVAIRLGSSLGGNDIMTDQTVAAATTLTIVGGLSRASRGSAMLVANMYEAGLDPGAQVWMRATTTGTITQGAALTELFGYFQP